MFEVHPRSRACAIQEVGAGYGGRRGPLSTADIHCLGSTRKAEHHTLTVEPLALRTQERVVLKDCQVGAGYVVQEATEHRDEVLAKPMPHRRSSDGPSLRRPSDT